MKFYYLIIVVCIFGLYYLEYVGAEDNCTTVPGYLLTKIKGRRWTKDEIIRDKSAYPDIPDEVARKNERDFTYRNCCDYKNKCSFQLQFHKSRNFCTLRYKCTGVDGTLKMQRVNNDGHWSGTSYCFSPHSLTTMYGSTCQDAVNCLEGKPVPDSPGPWLNCFERVIEANFNNDYKGFFSTQMFPYKQFKVFETEKQVLDEM